MQTKKTWDQKLMLSLFKKESAYNAAVTVNSTNFCSIKNHSDFNPDFADIVKNDKDTVNGTEYGTTQDIAGYGFKYQFSTPNVKPNELIGLVALAEGGITSTKDGANDAYTHDIVEVAMGTALPSINGIGTKVGIQYLLKGIKSNGYEIKGDDKKGSFISFTSDLIGSGYRAINADSFAAEISESWLRMGPSKIYLASGADISIDAVLTQGTQNISATTPTNLSAAVKAFAFKRGNNMTEQGCGNAGYAADIDYGVRTLDCTIELRWADYITLYEAQTALAVEIDCAQGSKIDTDGSLYFGFKIVIARCMLKKHPFPVGGVKDEATCTFELDIQNDGTHKPFYLQAYNAVPAYLAA